MAAPRSICQLDGGANFGATGLGSKLSGGERATCIAISPDYGHREIAIGTATGHGSGRVLMNITGGFSGSWHDMSTGSSGWLPGSISGVDVFALKYSSGFASDGALLAVVASGPPPNTDDTYLYMGIRDLGGNTISWNNSAGYPVEISPSGQDTPGTPLIYADIALPADYSSANPAQRHVYACWSAGNPNDGVYRLDDSVCYRILVRDDSICSSHITACTAAASYLREPPKQSHPASIRVRRSTAR